MRHSIDYKLIWVNDRVCERTGRDRKWFAGQAFGSHIHTAARLRIIDIVERMRVTKMPHSTCLEGINPVSCQWEKIPCVIAPLISPINGEVLEVETFRWGH